MTWDNITLRRAMMLGVASLATGCSVNGLDELDQLKDVAWVRVDGFPGGALDQAVHLEPLGDSTVVSIGLREIEATAFEFAGDGRASVRNLEEVTFRDGVVVDSFTASNGANAVLLADVDGTTRLGAIRPGEPSVVARVVDTVEPLTGVAVSGQRGIIGTSTGPIVVHPDGTVLGECDLSNFGALTAGSTYLFAAVDSDIVVLTVDAITSGNCPAPASSIAASATLGELLVSGDSNGDTLVDVLAASTADQRVLVWDLTLVPTTEIALPLPSDAVPSDLAFGDFDDDGVLEIAVAAVASETIYLFDLDGSELEGTPLITDVDEAPEFGRSIAAMSFGSRHVLSVGTSEGLFTYFRLTRQLSDPRR